MMHKFEMIKFETKNTIYFPFKLKKLHFGNLGKNFLTFSNCIFINAKNIYINDYVYIGPEAYFAAISSVIIGSGVMIGPRLTCITSNHAYYLKDLKSIPYDNRVDEKKVVIEDGVWIGANVNICPGVKIGRGSIIGMGAVVSKNIPDYAIAVGNPINIIGFRDKEIFEDLYKKGSFYKKEFPSANFEVLTSEITK